MEQVHCKVLICVVNIAYIFSAECTYGHNNYSVLKKILCKFSQIRTHFLTYNQLARLFCGNECLDMPTLVSWSRVKLEKALSYHAPILLARNSWQCYASVNCLCFVPFRRPCRPFSMCSMALTLALKYLFILFAKCYPPHPLSFTVFQDLMILQHL